MRPGAADHVIQIDKFLAVQTSADWQEVHPAAARVHVVANEKKKRSRSQTGRKYRCSESTASARSEGGRREARSEGGGVEMPGQCGDSIIFVRWPAR